MKAPVMPTISAIRRLVGAAVKEDADARLRTEIAFQLNDSGPAANAIPTEICEAVTAVLVFRARVRMR